MFKDAIQDLKAFGGFPIFVVLILTTYLVGQAQLSTQILIGLVLAFATTTLCRVIYFRPRPEPKKYKTFLQKIDAASFPSLHAMRAMLLALLFGNFFALPALTGFFVLVTLGVAYVRVYQKRHHMSDVIAGLILGVPVAYAAIYLASFV